MKVIDPARVAAMWSPEARGRMLRLRDTSVSCSPAGGLELRAKGHRFDPEWLDLARALAMGLARS